MHPICGQREKAALEPAVIHFYLPVSLGDHAWEPPVFRLMPQKYPLIVQADLRIPPRIHFPGHGLGFQPYISVDAALDHHRQSVQYCTVAPTAFLGPIIKPLYPRFPTRERHAGLF